MNNMEFWDKAKQPPRDALKTIKGGRLSGMTDISPQWRYQVMTEHYGPCGIGWHYVIKKMWSEDGAEGQKFAFAEVALQIWDDEKGHWSAPISGIGGSMLIAKEKSGLHSSDEGYKMAVTDALSVAMKMLGVAADIYLGKFDGSKYKVEPAAHERITAEQAKQIKDLLAETDADVKAFLKFAGANSVDTMTTGNFAKCIGLLNAKKASQLKAQTSEREPGSDDE